MGALCVNVQVMILMDKYTGDEVNFQNSRLNVISNLRSI
jgi:hypothetical protein